MSGPILGSSVYKVAMGVGGRKFMLGKCYPCHVPNATKIFVRMLDFDDWLKMYFRRYDVYFAHDPNKITKEGDTVLIEELSKRLTRDITHKVVKVVYPLGDVTDPITGKKCMDGEYRDEVERRDRLWGKNENAFDYDSAPPRGWQEGKKDFSHRPAQRKFHEFKDKDITHMDWK